MDNIQCMVGEIRDEILSDIVRRLLADNNITDCSASTEKGELQVADYVNLDYFIMDSTHKSAPSEYKNIFNMNSELMVIELLNNGKSMCVHIDNVNNLKLSKILGLQKL